MKPCRECSHEVSEQAAACPRCGAPVPADQAWNGWGFEYRSKLTILNLPLLHISFKYRPNRTPVPACGIIAIGQFAAGVVTVSQFGIGFISVSQFTVALYALAQIGIAWSLVAQIGLYVHWGFGQVVRSVGSILALF